VSHVAPEYSWRATRPRQHDAHNAEDNRIHKRTQQPNGNTGRIPCRSFAGIGRRTRVLYRLKTLVLIPIPNPSMMAVIAVNPGLFTEKTKRIPKIVNQISHTLLTMDGLTPFAVGKFPDNSEDFQEGQDLEQEGEDVEQE
jgi:hypothetical protein